jgi:hypothetical protein
MAADSLKVKKDKEGVERREGGREGGRQKGKEERKEGKDRWKS